MNWLRKLLGLREIEYHEFDCMLDGYILCQCLTDNKYWLVKKEIGTIRWLEDRNLKFIDRLKNRDLRISFNLKKEYPTDSEERGLDFKKFLFEKFYHKTIMDWKILDINVNDIKFQSKDDPNRQQDVISYNIHHWCWPTI